MASNFYAYMSRMKLIQRWGLMRNIQPENIQEHSYQVAVLAHALCEIERVYFGNDDDSGSVVLLALYHDVGEVLIGDLPTPVKYYNPEIRRAYGEIEQVAKDKLLSLLPVPLEAAYRPLFEQENNRQLRIVKAADKLAAYLKCLEEGAAGNKEFIQAEKGIRLELDKFSDLPAVAWFLEHCADGYARTLDELD